MWVCVCDSYNSTNGDEYEIRTRAGWEAKYANEENKISDFVARITTQIAHAEKNKNNVNVGTPPSDYSKKLLNTEHNRTLPIMRRNC